MWTPQHDRHAGFSPSSSFASALLVLSIVLIELLLLLTRETNGRIENRSQNSMRKIYFSKRLHLLFCTIVHVLLGEISLLFTCFVNWTRERPWDKISKAVWVKEVACTCTWQVGGCTGRRGRGGKDKINNEHARCGIRLGI